MLTTLTSQKRYWCLAKILFPGHCTHSPYAVDSWLTVHSCTLLPGRIPWNEGGYLIREVRHYHPTPTHTPGNLKLITECKASLLSSKWDDFPATYILQSSLWDQTEDKLQLEPTSLASPFSYPVLFSSLPYRVLNITLSKKTHWNPHLRLCFLRNWPKTVSIQFLNSHTKKTKIEKISNKSKIGVPTWLS